MKQEETTHVCTQGGHLMKNIKLSGTWGIWCSQPSCVDVVSDRTKISRSGSLYNIKVNT